VENGHHLRDAAHPKQAEPEGRVLVIRDRRRHL
jgi:hypothetical protein